MPIVNQNIDEKIKLGR